MYDNKDNLLYVCVYILIKVLHEVMVRLTSPTSVANFSFGWVGFVWREMWRLLSRAVDQINCTHSQTLLGYIGEKQAENV